MLRIARSCGLVLVLVASAAADDSPVASVATPPPPPPSDRAAAPAPTEPEPDATVLASAPPADQASGVAIAQPRRDHRVANTLLAIPRGITLLLLTGPRYGAAELDRYLDARSPNAYGRDVHQSWRFGATADWEPVLGGSLGARVGRELGEAVAVDAYGGLFGARGQSFGARAQLGRYTAANLAPALGFDAGRELARVYAGIGDDAGPRAGFHERMYAATASLAARVGPLRLETRGVIDHVAIGDHGSRPVSELYDETMITGFGETQRGRTVELAVAYDARHPTHAWIPAAAPSAGFYVRGAGAYLDGEAARTGGFSTWRGTLEARQLFDLFHGDRVLSIGVYGEAITADATALPFDRLPSLGGRDRMRALARDQLRDRATTFADVQYEWALGADSRGYLFVETGAVHPGPTDLAAARFHAGYGGGIRFLGGGGTSARFQVAGSETGDVGFFLQLGAL